MAGPDTLKKLLEYAENRYHCGEYSTAIQLWEKALVLDPENRRAKEGAKMARMLIEAGEKLPVEKRILEENQHDAGPYAPDSLEEVGNLQELLDDNQAVAKDIQTHIDRGWELLRNGDRDGALGECQEALVLDASNAAVMKLHAALSEGGASVIEEVEVPPEEDSDSMEPEEMPEAGVDDDFRPPAFEGLRSTQPEPPAAEAPGESPALTLADTQAVPPEELEAEPQVDTIADVSVDVESGDAIVAEPDLLDEPAAPIADTDQLIPDALKAGGTEYGQWENEFSELDLAQSVRNVGTEPIGADGDAPAGEEAPGGGEDPVPTVMGNLSMPESWPQADPEPVPLAEPGEIVMPETPGPAEAAPDMPELQSEAMSGEGEIPEDQEDLDDDLPELAASVPQVTKPKTSGFGGGRSLIGILLVVAVAAAGGWFFFLRGTGYSAGNEDPVPEAADSKEIDRRPDAQAPGPPGPSNPPNPGGEQNRPGSEEIQLPPKPEPPPTTDPDAVGPLSEAEKQKKISSMLRTGRQLYQEGKYEHARDILSAALAIDPVNFELKDLLDQVSTKAAEEKKAREALELARRAFEDGDFEIVLRKLYRTPTAAEKEPTSTYIRNTWFNWGVQLLKAGNCPEAKNKFREVQALTPDDQEIVKLISVADRYSRQAKDDIYYAFIDQLRFRDLEQP